MIMVLRTQSQLLWVFLHLRSLVPSTIPFHIFYIFHNIIINTFVILFKAPVFFFSLKNRCNFARWTGQWFSIYIFLCIIMMMCFCVQHLYTHTESTIILYAGIYKIPISNLFTFQLRYDMSTITTTTVAHNVYFSFVFLPTET